MCVAWHGVVFVDNRKYTNLASLTPHGGLHIEARFLWLQNHCLFLVSNVQSNVYLLLLLDLDLDLDLDLLLFFLAELVFFPPEQSFNPKKLTQQKRQEGNKATTRKNELGGGPNSPPKSLHVDEYVANHSFYHTHTSPWGS